MKDEKLYLRHAQECIDWIGKFTVGGKDVFLADKKTQDAVLRNLQTLAESIQKIEPVYRSKYPDVPWKQISTFRNVVVHEYLGIDLELIWGILDKDIPVLKESIQSILDHENKGKKP